MILSAGVWCIATAIYNESRGQPRQTQELVAATILNRARENSSNKEPRAATSAASATTREVSVCRTVRQPRQYSIHRVTTSHERKAFNAAVELAKDALYNRPEYYLHQYKGYKYFNTYALGVRFGTNVPPVKSGGMYFY